MLHSLWILAATFFTVLTYVFVKWVPPQYEIWDIFFVRSCYMAFFAVLMAAVAKTPLKTKIPKAHIGRAICGMLALLINIVTVQHLQIGTAETLFYTMPLFVSLFVIIEKMRLGERTDWVLVGSVLFAVLRAFAWCCSLPAEAMNCPMPCWLCFRRFWRQVQRCS